MVSTRVRVASMKRQSCYDNTSVTPVSKGASVRLPRGMTQGEDAISTFDACKTSKNVRKNFIDDTRSVITTNDVRGQKMIN